MNERLVAYVYLYGSGCLSDVWYIYVLTLFHVLMLIVWSILMSAGLCSEFRLSDEGCSELRLSDEGAVLLCIHYSCSDILGMYPFGSSGAIGHQWFRYNQAGLLG